MSERRDREASIGPEGSPSVDSRRTTWLAARAKGASMPSLLAIASRFGGHLEASASTDDMAIVRWNRTDGLESSVRMASAIHAEVLGTDVKIGVGLVAELDDEGARGLELVQALGRLAPAGQTLVSAEASQMPRSVGCEPFGTLQPDPLDDPLVISRVVSVAAAETELRGRTVGRDAELASIRHLATTVIDRGRGAVVHVVGDAGIGKSHLLAEIRRIAIEHGFGCHRASHDPDGRDHRHSPLTMLSRGVLEALGATSVLEGSTEPMAPPSWLDDGLHPFLLKLLEQPPRVEDRRLFEAMLPEVRAQGNDDALRALVRRCLEKGPVLIAVEDMHWSTVASRRGLQAIASLVSEGPLVVAMTSRPGADPIDDEWIRSAGGPPFVRIELDRLHRDDARVLAASIVSSRRSPWMVASDHYVRDELMLQCIERSGGHPLLLEQMLLDAHPTTRAQMPDSVAELVAARVAALPAALQHALGVAAAIGEQIDAELLGDALDGAAWTPGPAVAAGLLEPDGAGHRFAHALVRDAIYAALGDEERRAIHLTLASHLRRPGLRAEQLERASDPRAASVYLEAARHEDEAARMTAARAFLERGLALDPDDETGLELHALGGRIDVDEGRAEEGRQAFDAMLALAKTPIQRGRALVGIVSASRLRSRLEEAEAPLREAESLADEHGLEGLRGLCAYYRGCLLFSRGEVQECLLQHERAAEHARRSGQPRTEALALSGLGDAYYAQSRIATALGVIDRCVTLAREHGYGRIEVANLFMVGALRALENDIEQGLEDCLEAARMASRVGNRRAQMLAELNVGMCLTPQGRTEAALAHIEQAKHIATQMDARVFVGMIRAFEARAHRLGGDLEQARRSALAALDVARSGSMRFFGGVALGALARSAQGDEERASALREGEELLAGACVSHNYFYFYEDAIETCLETAQWERAEGYADGLDAATDAEPIARCSVVGTRARVLSRLGRASSEPVTRSELRQLRETLATVGMRPLLARVDDALATVGGE